MKVSTIILFLFLFFSVSFCLPIVLLAANQGDIFEPDDSYAEPQVLVIAPDETVDQEHTFHKFFDEDWIQFDAIKGHTYSINAVARDSNFECDPIIELFAGDGTSLLKRENKSDPGGNEFLEWTSPADSTFFIRFTNDSIYYNPSVIYDISIYASLFDPLPGYLIGRVTSNSVGIKGVVIQAGGGAGVSQSDGSYIVGLTPDPDDAGGTSFIISMHKDGYFPKSFSATIRANETTTKNVELVQIADPNQPPAITGTPPNIIIVNGLYSFRPIATDPENDSFSFSIANKPSWLSFNPENGMVLGVPNANHVGKYESITITVQDSRGASSNLPPFMIEVQNIKVQPGVSLPGVLMLLLK